jgi:hypothetical protein
MITAEKKPPTRTLADITIENCGTIFLFQPLTEAARDWIEENVVGETLWFGSALAVEARYAYNLAHGMIHDGLKLQ